MTFYTTPDTLKVRSDILAVKKQRNLLCWNFYCCGNLHLSRIDTKVHKNFFGDDLLFYVRLELPKKSDDKKNNRVFVVWKFNANKKVIRHYYHKIFSPVVCPEL